MGLTTAPTRPLPQYPWPDYIPQIEHIWKPQLKNAITENSLTSGSDITGTATSVTTASVSPGSNRLIIIIVNSVDADLSAPQTPTASGNGFASYTQVVTQVDGSNLWRCTMLRALGASPSTGAITIDFAGVQQLAIAWSVFEFDGVDTSGTNGSGAIVQSAGNNGTATSLTVTLAAFGSTNNVGVGGFGHQSAGAFTMSVGSGFTQIHKVTITGTNDILLTEYKLNDNTVDFSISTSDALYGVAAEIKAATAGTTRPVKMAGQWGGFAGSSGGFAG